MRYVYSKGASVFCQLFHAQSCAEGSLRLIICKPDVQCTDQTWVADGGARRGKQPRSASPAIAVAS